MSGPRVVLDFSSEFFLTRNLTVALLLDVVPELAGSPYATGDILSAVVRSRRSAIRPVVSCFLRDGFEPSRLHRLCAGVLSHVHCCLGVVFLASSEFFNYSFSSLQDRSELLRIDFSDIRSREIAFVPCSFCNKYSIYPDLDNTYEHSSRLPSLF